CSSCVSLRAARTRRSSRRSRACSSARSGRDGMHANTRRWHSTTTRSPSPTSRSRSEEHTSELQSLTNLVCRLLLEKKKNKLHPAHMQCARKQHHESTKHNPLYDLGAAAERSCRITHEHTRPHSSHHASNTTPAACL